MLGQLRDVMEQLSKLNFSEQVNSVTGKVDTLEEQVSKKLFFIVSINLVTVKLLARKF